VPDPEQRARHLALAAIRLDPDTVAALDEAAHRARRRRRRHHDAGRPYRER
jgi:hypothetical protein